VEIAYICKNNIGYTFFYMISIALFVYNRPEHTQRTLLSLQRANNADKCSLYIFSDGAKSQKDCAKVNEVRRVCSAVSGFASVSIIERESNFGLAKNIISGLSDLFEVHERVVVLEDDLAVSYGFIHYMVSALEFYKSKGVFSISAYTPNVAIPDNYKSSTYVVPRTCSWGWATWRERWKMVDWNVSDFDEFISNGKSRSAFNKAGDDLTPMLLRQQLGVINSWSIRFTYAAFKCGQLSVYPVRSLVENCGVDGSGTNMKSSSRYESQLTKEIDLNLFVDNLQVNYSILRSFRLFYNTSFIRRIINYLKIRKYIFRL
jgi:hypothetical protein